MEFERVMGRAELPANSMKVVTVGGKQVLLANVDGAIHAIGNKCTHLGASLGKGAMEGGIVTVPDPEAAQRLRIGAMNGLSATAWERYGRSAAPISHKR